jgi:thiol:disulfide interchange protein DsbA
MKHLKWIGPLLFTAALLNLYSCSKEEAAVVPAEEPAAAAEQAMETAPEEAADSSAEEASEVLEVVEESAAEAEPVDEAIVLAVADKIEVSEFFWYGCPHCYDLEPYINEWAEKKDPNVRFVRIPASWNALVRLHAQLYYTEEVLVRNGIIKNPGEFRDTVFQEYHRRGNRMTSEEAIQKVFARFGVNEDQFQSTWNSFEVNQKMRVADDLARRYSITSVPAVVVNGKYRSGAAEAGSYPKLMELIDELVVRESLR